MWQTMTLEKVCKIISGNSIPAKKKEECYTDVEGMPYVATKDVGFDGAINYENGIFIPDEYLSGFKISPAFATLVCAEGGSAGRKIAFSTEECCFVNKLFSLQPNENIIPKFIYYYTLGTEFQSQFKEAMHGLIGGVSLSKIKDFYISIPPLAEQQRIVAKLDAAFAEIDEARDANYLKITEMNALSNLVFDEWLTKFPIHSEIGKLCDFLNGYAFKSGDAVEQSDVQLLRMGNLYGNQLDLNRKPIFYPNKFADEYQKYVLNCGDIIMTLTGTVGKEDYGYAIEVPKTEKKLLLNQRILKFHNIDTNLIHPQFFLHVLHSQQFLKKLYKTANGTRQANLSSETIRKLEIPLPSIKEQEELLDKFGLLLTNKDIVVSNAEKNVLNCSQLKSAILAKELQSEAA